MNPQLTFREGLALIVAFVVAFGALAVTSAGATDPSMQEVPLMGGLDTDECDPDNDGWHFVVTQVRHIDLTGSFVWIDHADAPDHAIPLDRRTGNVAHYLGTDHGLNAGIEGATLHIADNWNADGKARFNLSHRPCGDTQPTPTPTGTETPREEVIPVTPEVKHPTCEEPSTLVKPEDTDAITYERHVSEGTVSITATITRLDQYHFGDLTGTGWVLTDEGEATFSRETEPALDCEPTPTPTPSETSWPTDTPTGTSTPTEGPTNPSTNEPIPTGSPSIKPPSTPSTTPSTTPSASGTSWTPPSASSTPQDELPRTGSNTGTLLVGMLGLFVLGGVSWGTRRWMLR